MARSRAEIQAAYRQRKRQKMGENAYLQAERQRVKKYYKPVDTLTKKRVQERRTQVNRRVRKHRDRVRRVRQEMEQRRNMNIDDVGYTADDDSAISDISPDISNQLGLTIKMPFQKPRRKRVSRCLSKAHRNIEQLTLKLQAAKKDKTRLKKRCERLQNKVMTSMPTRKEVKNTPRSRTNSQLEDEGIDPSRVPSIRKRLLFSNAMMEEIQGSSNTSRKMSDRRILHQLVAGSKVLKKYRLLKLLRTETGLGRRNLSKANKHTKSTQQSRPTWTSLHLEVVEFLHRDDVSRMCPGKKDSSKGKDGTKCQKRYLTDYLSNLHERYLAETDGKRKISLSAFNRVRRTLCPHIKPVQFASRDLCLCQKHQNVALKLKALQSLGGTVNDNPDEFIKEHNEAQVDILLNNLQSEQIQFDEWSRVEVDGRKKIKIIRISQSKPDFIKRFQKEIQEFRQHVVRIKNQFRALLDCKNSLKPDECIIQMDFAENYVCVPLEEVQSAYWCQDGVTLHPIVVYFRNDGNELVHQSFAAVSDDRNHNTSTILAILTKLMPKLKELIPHLHKVHYWTDSPTSQYRNKTMFSLVSEHADIFDGIHAQWNYFESGHGKGPCDGIGGTIKRLADTAVKRRAAVIQDAHDFFAWASQERHECSGSKINFFFVAKGDCAAGSLLIAERWSSVKTFPGTMQMHAVIGHDNGVLLRKLSCYCQSCYGSREEGQVETMCEGWKHNRLLYRSTTMSTTGASVTPQSPSNTSMSENDESSPTTNEASSGTYGVDDWVAAVYDKQWYIGKVLKFDSSDIHIDFMAKCSGTHTGGKYKWPVKKDAIWVAWDKVLCHITPCFCDTSQRIVTLSPEQKALIEEAFKAVV
ncbi:uncharacterized protein LOC129283486 [Lytechinus pictus]|uniref:uncharacterized protein LOC129283486 n=1 Tax=Lytechinus pictus TaxID=7653 RepID=UPI0030B9BC6B